MQGQLITRYFWYLHLNPEQMGSIVLWIALQAFIDASDRQNGLKFDCNQEAILVRGERPLIDFNYSLSL